MTLRIAPRWPLVWRDPYTLQIGVDPARVVLEDVTTLEEKIVAALTVGMQRRGLEVIASADPRVLDALLDRLRPVLQETTEPGPVPRIAVTGVGALAEAIRTILRGSGHDLVPHDSTDSPGNPDLAVVVGHGVLDPELHSYWLRRDVPHLPVVASDSAVQVGPLIRPGDGPCLLCLELHRRDGDVAWPAIATQLLGRGPGPEHPALIADTAATVARRVERWLAGTDSAGHSVRVDEHGDRDFREWSPHPECGCRGIAHLVGATTGRPGTGSPGAESAPAPLAPTTGRDVGGLG